MKLTSVGRDTLHKLDQPLKELAYVSNHWGPFLFFTPNKCYLLSEIVDGVFVFSGELMLPEIICCTDFMVNKLDILLP